MRKTIALLLMLPMILVTFIPCAAAETPAVPRVYRPEMTASVVYYNSEKYIALDIGITDITEPTGLLGIDFYVLFDGDKLDPLWKTDFELNGNGTAANDTTPPQMITSWPTYSFSFMGQDFEIFAAEGLCKAYDKTGKGVLNVDIVSNVDYYDFGVYGDNELAVRLYFKPINGFVAGETYTFTIDGQYDETLKQNLTTGGVDNKRPVPGVAYGYGDSTSYTVTWADCGAFDLADTTANITPDGAKNILWVDKTYTASELKACFKNGVTVTDANGKSVVNSASVAMGYQVSTSEGTLTVAMRGDINCDGVVSTSDYTLLVSALSGNSELTQLQSKIADLSGEGAVTTTDAEWFKRLF